jgi:hypothetical protein
MAAVLLGAAHKPAPLIVYSAPAGDRPAGADNVHPTNAILPNGRIAAPVGSSVFVGTNPLGMALSPDGRYIVVTNGDDRTGGQRGMRVREAVLQAAGTRFRPILMTTFAMMFGMLPLALGFAEGGEWRQAIGTVIIGGLLSSLILTLFLVPVTYNTWIGSFERGADRRALAAEMSRPAAATRS